MSMLRHCQLESLQAQGPCTVLYYLVKTALQLMNPPCLDCHLHNAKGRSEPCSNSACLGFHVTTVNLSHKTKAFPVLHHLVNKISEVAQLYISFLQCLSQGQWCAQHLLWEHTEALGIHFLTRFQQWLWSAMLKNKGCWFSNMKD